MPASRKINKDDIIRVCLDIVRKDGINGINARRVAKGLNCSTQPIFYLYKNMDEIKDDLYKEISNIYFNYIRVYINLFLLLILVVPFSFLLATLHLLILELF